MGNNRELSDSKQWYESAILRLAAIIGALALIFTQTINVVKNTSSITPEYMRVILAGLNLIILILYCLISNKVTRLSFINTTTKGRANYCSLLNIRSEENTEDGDIRLAEKNNERVNILVKQLNTNILWYCIFLMIVYFLYIVDTKGNPYHEYYKIGEDIFNYLSSVFIYLAFKVLYDKTLDDDNGRLIYYTDAIIFSAIYILAYVFFVIAKFNMQGDPTVRGTTLTTTDIVANSFGLFSGIFNGLAMALLFGRYISMEHSVNNIHRIKYNDVISLGTIFILPLYALSQPLFGSFEINAFGDPQVFANWVFFICLIGKGFFLYLTVFFIRKKLMHLYMHLVIARHGVPNKFDTCFKIE